MKFIFIKKLVLLTALSAVLAPAQVRAEYKALLKSGEELYASDYWLDKVDNQIIRLDINGNMARFPRDQFLYIAPVAPGGRRVRTAIKRITFAPKENRAMAALGAESAPAAETSAPTPQPLQEPQAGADAWRNEAERIDREREAAKDDFKKALTGGDFSLRQRARQRILDLTEERSTLLEKVKVANSGVIPDWWRWKTEN